MWLIIGYVTICTSEIAVAIGYGHCTVIVTLLSQPREKFRSDRAFFYPKHQLLFPR